MWFAHNPLQLRAAATEKLLPPGSYLGTTITSLVSTVSGATQKPQGSEKTQDKLPSPPSASSLGQGRAEPQAQTWKGCCQLLKVQGTALPGHESPTPFFSSTRTPWALLFALNTHRLLGVPSLPSHSLLETLYELFSNAFILFD